MLHWRIDLCILASTDVLTKPSVILIESDPMNSKVDVSDGPHLHSLVWI